MEKFKTVLDLYLKKHRNTLTYGLVTLLTAGGEKIFSAAVFQCPCSTSWNLPYSLVYLLVPALALFLLGYALNARTWRLLTGCCARRGASCARGTLVCAHLGVAAALAPLTWIAVALLGGSIYECAASGSTWMARRLCGENSTCDPELPLVPCSPGNPGKPNLLKQLRAESQVLGWVLIAVVIIFLLVFTSILRCLSPVSFLQLKFWKIYLEKEQEILQSQAREHATEMAKENVRCFFERSHPKEYNTPSNKAWQQISSLYTFNPKSQYYSMLHKYVSRQETGSIKSMEGDAMIPVLGFVDSPAIQSPSDLYT